MSADQQITMTHEELNNLIAASVQAAMQAPPSATPPSAPTPPPEAPPPSTPRGPSVKKESASKVKEPDEWASGEVIFSAEDSRDFDWSLAVKWQVSDPRANGEGPCENEHLHIHTDRNQGGRWWECAVCGLRLQYVPVKGKSGQYRRKEKPETVKKALENLHKMGKWETMNYQDVRREIQKIELELAGHKANVPGSVKTGPTGGQTRVPSPTRVKKQSERKTSAAPMRVNMAAGDFVMIDETMENQMKRPVQESSSPPTVPTTPGTSSQP